MASSFTRPSNLLLRYSTRTIARFATATSETPHRPRRQYGPPRPHEHSKPSEYLGSWKHPAPAADPREAQKRLDMLRRDYARQVRERRKQYILEMDLQRLERLRREEARLEAVRLAKEQRKAAKKEADEARAAKHMAFQEELRQTLLKERTEKLENWRAKEASREAKKKEKRELLQRQSSVWIDEAELDEKIRDALMDTCNL